MKSKGIKRRIRNRVEELHHMVNCDDYNGMSLYWYYTKEEMPTHISNIKWALNKLCYDMMTKKERDELNELINEIKW